MPSFCVIICVDTLVRSRSERYGTLGKILPPLFLDVRNKFRVDQYPFVIKLAKKFLGVITINNGLELVYCFLGTAAQILDRTSFEGFDDMKYAPVVLRCPHSQIRIGS